MELQKLLSYVRRTIQDYNMIEDGDRIAVGVSGGKDSLALVCALKALQRFYPKKFELKAISVDLGFEKMNFAPVKEFCKKLEVDYTVVQTDIGDIIFNYRKEKNPCALCSKMRKGALNSKIEKMGFNKVALGHNRDDVIQTYFMSLFYEGRIYCFSPVTYLDRMKITSIRPLIYVPEFDIISYARKAGLPVIKNKCPADGNTKREEIKHFIKKQRSIYKNFDSNIFGAIKRNLWNKKTQDF